MVNVLVRLIRVLPALGIFAVCITILYGVLVTTSTRERARRILVKIISIVSAALTVFFALATLYAWFEQNVYVLEVADVCAILFGLCFIGARLAAWYLRRSTHDGNHEK